MQYYGRTDVSERVNVNKTSASKECDVYHYWYSLNCSFQFPPNLCNRCHDLLMSINLSDIAILNIEGSDYHHIISLISKNEAIKFMQNTDLTKKTYIKMGKEILTFGNIEIEKKNFFCQKTPIF